MLTEVATLVVRHMGKVAEEFWRQTHMGEARHCVPGQVDRIELHMRQIVQPVQEIGCMIGGAISRATREGVQPAPMMQNGVHGLTCIH